MSKRTKILLAVGAGVVVVVLLMRRRAEVAVEVAQKSGATAATPRTATALVALLADVGSIPGLALKGAGELVRKLPAIGGGTVALLPQTTPKPKAP